MEVIAVDGMDEHDFRHSVEDMLRLDQVDEALERLRALLPPFSGGGMYLPARFLEVRPEEVEIVGLDRLAARLIGYDRPGFPVSAIGLVLADARVLGGPGPRGGRLTPFIKTYYFTDDAYPFTEASRDDLLDGYTREGFGWQGDYQATDATLSIRGMDDLHGALIELEDRLLDRENPPEDAIRAGSIGACYLAVLIHRALREAIRQQSLPRPLCVLAACDGVYPFFDAPVAGWNQFVPEAAEALPGAPTVMAPDADADGNEDADGAEQWPNELVGAHFAALTGDDAVREPSLLSLFAPHREKHLALTLADEDLMESARFTAEAGAQRLVMTDDNALVGLFHGIAVAELDEEPEPSFGPPADFAPEPDGAASFANDVPEMPHRMGTEAWPEREPESLDGHGPPPGAEADPLIEEAAPVPVILPAAPTGHSLRERFRAPESAARQVGHGPPTLSGGWWKPLSRLWNRLLRRA
jgi:hypothetical protein